MRNKATREKAAVLAAFAKNADGMENHQPDLLIIDRRFWGRGGTGRLLGAGANGAVEMCCMGFDCAQRGKLPLQVAYGHAMPSDILEVVKRKSVPAVLKPLVEPLRRTGGSKLIFKDTELAQALAGVNDMPVGRLLPDDVVRAVKNLPGITMGKGRLRNEAHREQLITALYGSIGVRVVFVS